MTPDSSEAPGPDPRDTSNPAGADGSKTCSPGPPADRAATPDDPAPATDPESTRDGPQTEDPHATRFGEGMPDSAPRRARTCPRSTSMFSRRRSPGSTSSRQSA